MKVTMNVLMKTLNGMALAALMLAPCVAVAHTLNSEGEWLTKVTVTRGHAHTFWAKNVTADQSLSLSVEGTYTYKEDGETYEDGIFASEWTEVENSAGGFDPYVLLTEEDWEYVSTSIKSVTFTVCVSGWYDEEVKANNNFTFGHSDGDGDYPGEEEPEPEPWPLIGSESNPYRLTIKESAPMHAQMVDCAFSSYFEGNTYHIMASPTLVAGHKYYLGIGSDTCSNLTLSVGGSEVDFKTAAKVYEGWPNATEAWEFVPTTGGTLMMTVQGTAEDTFTLYSAALAVRKPADHDIAGYPLIDGAAMAFEPGYENDPLSGAYDSVIDQCLFEVTGFVKNGAYVFATEEASLPLLMRLYDSTGKILAENKCNGDYVNVRIRWMAPSSVSTTDKYYVGVCEQLEEAEEPSGNPVALTIQMVPCIVSFQLNGGTSPISEMEIYAGQPIGELPVATRDGFDFAGWYTADGKRVTDDTIVSGDIVCWARWVNYAYTTTYTGEGGSAINWTYIVTNGTAICCGADSAEGALAIPSEMGGVKVGGVDDMAFYGKGDLVSVKVPSGVKTCGGCAFKGCTNLVAVTLPDGMSSIGDYAFSGCSKLKGMTIPKGVTSIGTGAFYGCNAMTAFAVDEDNAYYKSVNGLLLTKDGLRVIKGVNGDVTIPDGVADIDEYAFSNCKTLSRVAIPSSTMNIGEGAFEGCDAIADVTVPGWQCGIDFSGVTNLVISEGTTGIGAYAFYDCNSLMNVTIPSSVTSIGESAFSWCGGLLSMTMAEGLVDIGAMAFSDCSGLTSIAIPEGVTCIGSSAFSGCSGLVDLSIPDSVTSMGSNAFGGCTGLGDGIVVIDGCVLTINGECPSDVELPQGTRLLADGVFFGCGTLASITIPDSVKGIGADTFAWCDGLTCVALPAGLDSIGSGAFQGCNGLVDVTIPEGVTNVGNWAFSYCGGLERVRIPSSVVHFGEGVFDGCGSITDAVVPGWRCGIDFSAVTNLVISAGTTNIEDYAFEYCPALTRVTIPSCVTRVGDCAFRGCYELDCLTIPEGVASIGDGAFADCSRLAAVTIPSSVTSIGVNAFSGCSGLASITVPEGVTNIRDGAFSGCSGLTHVVMPHSLTDIGEGVFDGCGSITDIVVPGWKCGIDFSGVTNLTISDGTTTIEDRAFEDCFALNHVTIPSGVTSIGSGVFSGCIGLLDVALPDSVAHIGEGAFAGCDNLSAVCVSEDNAHYCQKDGVLYDKTCETLIWCPPSKRYLTIEPSVTGICARAFYNCSCIEQIYLPSNVTYVGAHAFEGCNCGLTFMGPPPDSVGEGAFGGIGNGYAIYTEEFADEWALAIDASGGVWYECDGHDLTEWARGGWTYDNVGNGIEIRPPFHEEGWHGVSLGQSSYDFEICYDAVNCKYVSKISWASVPAGDLVIPSKLGGRPVVEISGECIFDGNADITSVVIPDGVTSICAYAFRNCSSLTNVVASANVKRVGLYAFSGCSLISQATFPTDCSIAVSQDESGYFEYADFAVSYLFPDSYRQVSHFVIPEGTKGVGANMFPLCCRPCIAFSGCESLMNVSIPESVTTIGNYAFYGCSKLSAILLPDSIESIGYFAFCGCSQLSAIELPEGIGSVGGQAFSGCSSLMSIALPDSLTEIGGGAFSGCTALKTIVLPSKLASVSDDLFSGCECLESITIPASVSSIGEYAFYSCYGLMSVTMSEGIKSIGEHAFSDCYGVLSIAIPNGVERIGAYAFENCTGLTKVAIPASVVFIPLNAFAGCSGIRDVTVSSDCLLWRDECDCDDDEEPILDFSLAALLPGSFASVTNVTVAKGSMYVSQGAFANCRALTSVTIPESVTAIDGEAFSHCGKLATVEFLGDAPDVGDNAFFGTPRRMSFVVADASVGWNGDVSSELPVTWQGRSIAYAASGTGGGSGSTQEGASQEDEESGGGSGTVSSSGASCVVISNVVVHYVMNSVKSDMAAPITLDTGIVNVMTEVMGGNVAIPESWATNYAGFVEMYGSDFSKALTTKSGKYDAANNPMFVWQDYVAGTDPTDETSVFRASVTMVDGVPVISYTPQLSEAEAVKRTYTIWGKEKLQDAKWVVVPSGDEAKYNFFKVTVEMK